MATNKQPPSGLNLDDLLAGELDDDSAGNAHTPLADETVKLETLDPSGGDEDDWGSETRMVKLPVQPRDQVMVNKQMARLQPLPDGVVAELDFGDQKFPLEKSLTIIGRVKEVADIALTDDDQLSRHHAAIVYSEGGFSVEDLESTNGTFIGGKRITRAPLGNGVEVTIGRHKFKLVVRS